MGYNFTAQCVETTRDRYTCSVNIGGDATPPREINNQQCKIIGNPTELSRNSSTQITCYTPPSDTAGPRIMVPDSHYTITYVRSLWAYVLEFPSPTMKGVQHTVPVSIER